MALGDVKVVRPGTRILLRGESALLALLGGFWKFGGMDGSRGVENTASMRVMGS